jgi:hypothetical protein
MMGGHRKGEGGLGCAACRERPRPARSCRRLSERLGIDIPEADYPKLFSKEGLLAYLVTKTGG